MHAYADEYRFMCACVYGHGRSSVWVSAYVLNEIIALSRVHAKRNYIKLIDRTWAFANVKMC